MLSNKVKVIANACIKGVREYNKEKPKKTGVNEYKKIKQIDFLV